ncbi:helix-turn-helix domain-containing protein [Burkholderia ubonensis]|nr:helix-turn-helix transcriptional regulator [Burkholderia ubonensis]
MTNAHLFNLSLVEMDFADRLALLRKQRGFTQQQLADRAKVHLVQINRYEQRVSRPAIEVVKRLAVALSVSADALLFNENETGPDDDFRPLFDGLRNLTTNEKIVAKSVLEALLLKHRMSYGAPFAPAIGKIVALNKATRRKNRGD